MRLEIIDALSMLDGALSKRRIRLPDLVFHDVESWLEMQCIVPFFNGKPAIAGFRLCLEVWPEASRWPEDMVMAAHREIK
jgi:hypothetical protein